MTGRGEEEAEAPETEDDPDSAAPICEVCGAEMYERHCKIICPRCGYMRDCSDP